MIVQFSKYHGTGNDFIMIDGRELDPVRFDQKLVRSMCDRRFGIGGDGLIILQDSDATDFRMRYYNSNGKEGTMCGNGGRCITSFAQTLGIITMDAVFEGIDGKHRASILPNGEVSLELREADGIAWMEDGYVIDTGSPHFVKFVTGLNDLDVELEGRKIRKQPRFGRGGVNVNFVEAGSSANQISVRTYERGVEAETFSCGTGAAAAAICSYFHFKSDVTSYHIQTLGGTLNVAFRSLRHNQFSEIFLTGPVSHVYDGTIEIGG